MHLIQGQNEELKLQIADQMDRNKHTEEEHRQNLLHIETLNMMTKYQLVYIKLETAIYKILATNEAKKKIQLKKAFGQFKMNATHGDRFRDKKRKFVIQIFKANLNKLQDVSGSLEKKRLQKFFKRWEHTSKALSL